MQTSKTASTGKESKQNEATATEQPTGIVLALTKLRKMVSVPENDGLKQEIDEILSQEILNAGKSGITTASIANNVSADAATGNLETAKDDNANAGSQGQDADKKNDEVGKDSKNTGDQKKADKKV